MESTANKIDFFISQLPIDAEDQSTAKIKVTEYLKGVTENRQIIFKRSIFYFYHGTEIVDTYKCKPTNLDVTYTFDGEKVSKLNKSYFVGATSSMFEVSFELSNNNNNNNNNNNGNNNNG